MEFIKISDMIANMEKSQTPTFARRCEAGMVPGAEKIDGQWYVSQEDLCKVLEPVELAEFIPPFLRGEQEAP